MTDAALDGLTVGAPRFNLWAGLLIDLPAVAAGIFGLLGGYLADLLGRRRALAWVAETFDDPHRRLLPRRDLRAASPRDRGDAPAVALHVDL